MTRQEKIEQAAKEYAENYSMYPDLEEAVREAFIKGAESGIDILIEEAREFQREYAISMLNQKNHNNVLARSNDEKRKLFRGQKSNEKRRD